MSNVVRLIIVGLIAFVLGSVCNVARVDAADDASYAQCIKDLGSSDDSVRTTAELQLMHADAIPALVQAIKDLDKQVALGAADVLIRMLDSPDAKIAAAAQNAVTDQEKSVDTDVMNRLQLARTRHHEAVMERLRNLDLIVVPRQDEYSVTVRGERWASDETALHQLLRLKKQLHVFVRYGQEADFNEDTWRFRSTEQSSGAGQGMNIPAQSFAPLAQLANVKSVGVSMCPADQLSSMSELQKLSWISVDFTDAATGAPLEHLAHCRALEMLRCINAPDVGPHLECLAELPKLKSLTIAYSEDCTNPQIGSLARLASLESLELINIAGVGSQWGALGSLPNLRKLTLAGPTVKDSDLAEIGAMKVLESLSVRGTSVTDDGIAYLKSLPRLKSLYLGGTVITDDAVPTLQEMSSLKSVHARDSFLTDIGVSKLRKSLPALQLFGGAYTPEMTADQHATIRELVRKRVRLSAVHILRDGSVELPQFGRPLSDPESPVEGWGIRAIVSDQCRNSEEALRMLVKLDRVASLSIYTALNDKAAGLLQNMPMLRILRLWNTGITDAGLKCVPHLRALKELYLAGPFTDAAESYLRQTSAKEVFLFETLISNAAKKRIQDVLRLNQGNAEQANSENRSDDAQAQVLLACSGASDGPQKPNAGTKVQRSARQRLASRGVEVLPLFLDLAQHGNDSQRIQALLLLHHARAFSNFVMDNSADGQEKFQSIARSFDKLKLANAERLGTTPTELEKALIDLGASGAIIIDNLSNYRVVIPASCSRDDAGASILAHLPQLGVVKSLDVELPSISGEGFESIGSLSDLQSLRIVTPDVDAAGMAKLVGLKSLTSLTLVVPRNSEMLSCVTNMANVKELTLQRVSDEALEQISQATQIENLTIDESPNFTGSGLRHLTGLTRLVSLGIAHSPRFTSDGLTHLPELKHLQGLSLIETGPLGASLDRLTLCPDIVGLYISQSVVTGDGLRCLGDLKQLKALTITNATVLDEHLQYFSGLPNLESLRLDSNAISDEGVVHVARCPALKTVSLGNTFVSSAAETRLNDALSRTPREPNVSYGDWQGGPPAREPVTSEFMAAVRAVVNLGANVSSQPDSCCVVLLEPWTGGDEGVQLLEKLGNVQSLCIDAPLTDKSIPYLKKLEQVRSLVFRHRSLSEAGLAELRAALRDTIIYCPTEDPAADNRP
jgi:Leucine-rich repeat (LRR) protein